MTGVFKTVETFKASVLEACNGDISTESFGYVEPGHGNRGKQQWLSGEEDLKDMYRAYCDKTEILLWAQRPSVGRRGPTHLMQTKMPNVFDMISIWTK